ncbi:Similar to S.cerevisiae protein TRM44 (tRNA(Ser) Um(44) 2'-O-methyltransferase) [Malassezia sympodialis ATCC 42132]|uniref:tRNA (uracil-O(2)-)-methyltransferase n=1 Tax=Malassezia sympodialis (strain ATCC 42132) TaxID=1230383 RepID=A0A1M8A9A9_MALS4|nr:Similar to S.cerevisiae protein TRM44 (tRNA(Ser) Um(44) 2'-O-methyltransferase) [Malassezia sympodialis ATCC 42132]
MKGRATSSAQASGTRAPFTPTWCMMDEGGDVAWELPDHPPWVRVIEAPAYFAFHDWHATMLAWIFHPERNSSSIRRGEIWQEKSWDVHMEEGMTLRYQCVRRLLPRRVHIDRGMLQECTIQHDGSGRGSVVYTTLRVSDQAHESPDPGVLDKPYNANDWPKQNEVPFYHPDVRAVAFRYQPQAQSDADGAPQGLVRVDFVLFPSDGTRVLPTSRLGRTAMSLLRLMHQHSVGHASSYVKRVHHDILVPRDAYQDLYLHLRSKYAGPVIEAWPEVTDPKKHVFEDIGIAAWLILLWRAMFPVETQHAWPHSARCGGIWGHPPGGFVDVGCGNGLLVHLLTQEGYHGYGFDGRARKSWPLYEQAGARLQVHWFDPAEIASTDDSSAKASGLPTGSFLIGNHADELTPWVPVLAARTPACTGFVNIPCCAWTLEGQRFVPSKSTLDDSMLAAWLHVDQIPEQSMPPVPLMQPSRNWTERLTHLGWFAHRATTPSEQGTLHSKHLAYNMYIASLHIRSGWNLETEALRIPSTKNMAFVARVRLREALDENSCRTIIQDTI